MTPSPNRRWPEPQLEAQLDRTPPARREQLLALWADGAVAQTGFVISAALLLIPFVAAAALHAAADSALLASGVAPVADYMAGSAVWVTIPIGLISLGLSHQLWVARRVARRILAERASRS